MLNNTVKYNKRGFIIIAIICLIDVVFKNIFKPYNCNTIQTVVYFCGIVIGVLLRTVIIFGLFYKLESWSNKLDLKYGFVIKLLIILLFAMLIRKFIYPSTIIIDYLVMWLVFIRFVPRSTEIHDIDMKN